jgi:hypothetical protein
VPRLAEIANDENSHDRIYVELIGQKERAMHTNDSLGARVAARVHDALTRDFNENHDEHGRFAAGESASSKALSASKDAMGASKKNGGLLYHQPSEFMSSYSKDNREVVSTARAAMNAHDRGDTKKAIELHSRAIEQHAHILSGLHDEKGYNGPSEQRAAIAAHKDAIVDLATK